jgi:hypothetical protein
MLVVGLFVAGGVVAIVQPWKGRLGPIETARLLEHRLRTHDEFDCSEPSGIPLPTEPDWDYICEDVTHPLRNGYFVKTSGSRITEIQSAG